MSSQRRYPFIIIQRAYLVTTAAAFLFLCYCVRDSHKSEWRQQQPARREQAIPSSSPQQTCRALFTITSVPRNHSSHKEADVSRYSKNGTFGGGLPPGEEWRVSDSAVPSSGGEESSVAGTRVRQLIRRRESQAGATTDDYYSLASLLPKLLVFGDEESGENHTRHADDDDANQGQWKKREYRLKPPFFRGRSRVRASGDTLPYVPCTVAPYDDPDNFTSCVKRRLQRKPRFWLILMGDSKIRYIFYEFLNRTDAQFQYAIHLLGRIMSWPDVRKNIHPFVWTDMEAVSQTEPRMRITFRFRRFSEMKPKLFNSTPELVELRRWASGADPMPDLLVVGYTAWMMQMQEMWDEDENHYLPDNLDFLLQMHKAVVPLLEQIGKRTRVLVVPQSRLRPHSYSTHNVRAAFSHSVFEWSEMTFLHLLRRHRTGKAPHQMVWDNQETGDKRGTTEQSTNSTDDTKPHGARELTTAQEDDSTTPRDHLVPTRSNSGVWWWDSSLPLNLAGILECEELYRRGFASHPAFKSRLLHCLDSQHVGTITSIDLVTMLFNLICNTYLGMDSSNCCS